MRRRFVHPLALAFSIGAGCTPAPTPPALAPPPRAPALPPPTVAPAPPAEPVFVLQAPFEDTTALLSPDGRLVASMSSGTTGVRLWTTGERKLTSSLAFTTASTAAWVQWGATGRALVVGLLNRVCVLDVANDGQRDCAPAYAELPPVTSLQRTRMAFLSDASARVVDLSTGAFAYEVRVRELTHVRGVSDSGRWLSYTVTAAETPVLYDSLTSRVLETPDQLLGFSADDRFAWARREARVVVRELRTETDRAVLAGEAPVFAPVGARLVVVHEGRATLWDPDAIATRALPVPDVVRAMWLGPSAVGLIDRDRILWRYDPEAASARRLGEVDAIDDPVRVGPDGTTAVVLGHGARLVELATGRALASDSPRAGRIEVGFTSPTSARLYVADERRVIELSSSGATDRGAFDGEPLPMSDPVTLDPRGALRFACDRGITQWDVARGAAPVYRDDGRVFARKALVETSADGAVTAVGVDKKIVVRGAKGEALARFEGGNATLDEAGAHVAVWTGYEPSLSVYEVARAATPLVSWKTLWAVEAVSFLPKTSQLLVSSHKPDDDTARRVELVDYVTGRATRRFENVVALPALSDDGRWAAIPTKDSVLIWDIGAAKVVKTLRGLHPGRLREIGFSPDGRKLALLQTASVHREGRGGAGGLVVDVATEATLATLAGARKLSWADDSESVFAYAGTSRSRTIFLAAPGAPERPPEPVVFASTVNVLRLIRGGRGAFFTDGGGRLGLVRFADGALLWLETSGDRARCSLFVHDDEGHFDGEPMGRVALRFGSDLRTAEVDASPSRVEALRRPGLLKGFLAPKP